MAVFFDASVLVQCTNAQAPDKMGRARSLVAHATLTGSAMVSAAGLADLYQRLVTEQAVPPNRAQALVLACADWQVVPVDSALLRAGMDLAGLFKLPLRDAITVQAAIQAGASTLYADHLQHGQRWGSLTLVNPFLGPAGGR